MTRRRKSASPFDFYTRSFDLLWKTGSMLAGSAEVITHRTNAMNKALRGEAAFPLAEVNRMWMEKFAAAMSFGWSLNKSALASAPLIFQNLQGVDTSAKLLQGQLTGLAEALKPYSRTVKSNVKRLRRGK